MKTGSILTKAQAEAVYSAMCALNDVRAKVKTMFGNVSTTGINVFEDEVGAVSVVRVQKYDVLESEHYTNQSAFAAAYGLSNQEQAG